MTSSKLYWRVALRILPLLFLTQLIGIIDRLNVGFAKLEMSADLGLSNAAYGLGAGLFFLGYFVLEIPSNLIQSRVGARAWFARILVTWGLATVAMGFVTNTSSYYVLRFLVGAAEAGFGPGAQLYVTRWFPDAFRGRVNACFLMSIPFASVVSGPASGYLLSSFAGVAGLHGWQWLFLIEGATTVVLGPILFFTLPNEPRDARWLSAEERAAIDHAVGATVRHAEASSLRALFDNPRMALIAGVYFLLLLGNYGPAFWMPQIIRNSGVQGVIEIGWLSAIPALCACIAMPVVSRLSDRGGRKWYLAGGCLLSATGLTIASMNTASTAISLAGLALTSVGVFGSIPVFWAYVTRNYAGPAAVVGFAVINSIGNLAGFVAPYHIGLVADATGSPVNGIYSIALAAILAAGLIALFFKSPSRAAEVRGLHPS